jgi:prepilin-type N-terminal cleavage/methylation domain-containing protein
MSRGFTLPELLIAASVLALLAGACFGSANETLARQRVEAASRRLEQGIEEARANAEQRRSACSLALAEEAWASPADAALPSCLAESTPLSEGVAGDDRLQLRHNLPAELRFTANGLLIDGGTVVIGAAGTALKRCLVVALPLGVVRIGRYGGKEGDALSSAACLPDPGL